MIAVLISLGGCGDRSETVLQSDDGSTVEVVTHQPVEDIEAVRSPQTPYLQLGHIPSIGSDIFSRQWTVYGSEVKHVKITAIAESDSKELGQTNLELEWPSEDSNVRSVLGFYLYDGRVFEKPGLFSFRLGMFANQDGHSRMSGHDFDSAVAVPMPLDLQIFSQHASVPPGRVLLACAAFLPDGEPLRIPEDADATTFVNAIPAGATTIKLWVEWESHEVVDPAVDLPSSSLPSN